MDILPGGLSASRYAIAGVDVVDNLYPEKTEDPQRPWALIKRPGKRTFATAGIGPIRAQFARDGRAFVVSGPEFYEVFGDGTTRLWGPVAAGGPATIDSNGHQGQQLFIVAGGFGYIFSLTANTLTLIVAAGFPAGAVMGGFVDGYFLVLYGDFITWARSDPFNGLLWDAAAKAQKTQTTDKIQALFVNRTEVWLLGSESTEPWWNNGGGVFPFTPVDNVIIQQGIASPYGWAILGETPYWVVRSKLGAGVVMRASSSTPERISTHNIEQRIQDLGEAAIGALRAYAYEQEGHRFFVLAFPTVTLTFDEASNQWAERNHYNTVTGQREADLAVAHMFVWNLHLVGSGVDGTIYQQSIGFQDDDGAAIHWRWRVRGPWKDGRPVFIPRLELHVQTGVGTLTATDPMVSLRVSIDGGQTWGNEYTERLGAIGAFATEVAYDRLGAGENLVFEFTGSDAVITAIVGASHPGSYVGRS